MIKSPQSPNASQRPLVSIVIPAYNDEEYIVRALTTASQQSLKNIEIICVDDKSTDRTVALIDEFSLTDPRVNLIKLRSNSSAFQARLAGVKAAKSPYILFLDGDDELHKDAAKLAYKKASSTQSDMVGFGSKIVRQDGSSSRAFEKSIQPRHRALSGENIVKGLFEPYQPAQGSLWRYLFTKELLLSAYSHLPSTSKLYRTNDLPISFLCAVLAKKYTSIQDRLYVYHFYAGESGGANFTIEKFRYYTKAIKSLDLLDTALANNAFGEIVNECYYSARLFVISNILRQILNNLPSDLHKQAIDILLTKVSLEEISFAMSGFIPEALDIIRPFLIPRRSKPSRKTNIALYTTDLATGGIQGVVVSQAKYLTDAGYRVTIILLKSSNIVYSIPDGINVETVAPGPLPARLRSYSRILRDNKIHVIIDHNVLYNFSWPYFNLVAKSHDVETIAWAHSFALRPMTEGNLTGRFMQANVELIDNLVVLSRADVTYWKSLGHRNVHYLPNPPSPMLLEKRAAIKPKKAPKKHLNLIWFGRLQQSTKKVYSLVDIASELRKLTSDFTLTIIGPHSHDLKPWQVREKVKKMGLEEHVKVAGPKHGDELRTSLKEADIYVSTSIIEGYQLTLLEAQSYALPVVMYELPWLTVTDNNHGVIQTPQKNPALAAEAIFELFTNNALYEDASKASIAATKEYLSHDFAALYSQLLDGTLPKEFSPSANLDHMGLFNKWTQFYFSELLSDGSSTNTAKIIIEKDAEIRALKYSKAMRIGNAVAKPVRVAKTIKHKLAKKLKNR